MPTLFRDMSLSAVAAGFLAVLVSLTGQFLPGMAILQAAGYKVKAKPVIAVCSLISLPVALFGGITTVVAAITAAICTGKDAHEDPSKRYVAGVFNGMLYIFIVPASGLSLFGLSSAFWGVVIGYGCYLVLNSKKGGQMKCSSDPDFTRLQPISLPARLAKRPSPHLRKTPGSAR